MSAGVGREGEKQWRGRQLEEEFFRRNLRVLGNGGGAGNRAKTESKQGQNKAKTEPKQGQAQNGPPIGALRD